MGALAKGLRQRVSALNRFLYDIYHGQEILKAGVIPAEQVLTNEAYQVAMLGLELPNKVYSHIAGIDLVRNDDGKYYVLEDNLRTPSGVSYMLENRKMMMRLFPELFARQRVHPVEHYPGLLLETLNARGAASGARSDGRGADARASTTAPTSSTRSWRSRWAWNWSKAATCSSKDGYVYMRTTAGRQRVDVIYRRLDDAFLDPLAFRQDSLLGVPGLLSVYRAGNVALANAIGTGVADDKSTYPYVPEMIRFYLGEEPLLDNVPTWQCRKPEDLELRAGSTA